MVTGYPDWFVPLIGIEIPAEGELCTAHSVKLNMLEGLLRDEIFMDEKQWQTGSTFSYKWKREETYSSDAMREHSRAWLLDRYGYLTQSDALQSLGERPLLLDAGCGSGYSSELLFGPYLHRVRYVGADISRAVDVAARKFSGAGLLGAFVQADLMRLPFPDLAFDIVFSEGVLHHTPSTQAALGAIAKKVRRGGIVAFYVYARKSPIREFSDDFIRQKIVGLPSEEAWARLLPLTKFGKALGELNITVDVPEAVELLGIPKGSIDLQRMFYWHICKMFYRPELSVDEMNHINFDWFAPTYAHRQIPDEIRAWCMECGLTIERMKIEEAGITTIAVRL